MVTIVVAPWEKYINSFYNTEIIILNAYSKQYQHFKVSWAAL